jgi:hypothetical protein
MTQQTVSPRNLMQTPTPSETMEMIMNVVPNGTRGRSESRANVSQSEGRKSSGAGDSNDPAGSTEKYKKVAKLRLFAKGLLAVSVLILFILLTVQLVQLKTFMNNALKQVGEEELHLMGFRFREQLVSTSSSLRALSLQSSIKQVLQGNASFAQEVERMLQEESSVTSTSLVIVLDANRKIVLSSGGSNYGQVYDPEGMVTEVYSAGYKTEPLFVSAAIQASEFFALNGTEFVDGTWSLIARQSMATTGQQVGLAQFVVLPLFSDTHQIIGSLLTLNLLNGNLDMIESLMDVFQSGFAGVYVKQNGTVYPISYAFYQDESELNFNYWFSSDEMNSIASAVLADSTADLVPSTTSFNTREYGYLYLSALRTEGWERDGQVSSSHRGQTILVRGTYSNQLDSDFTVLQGTVISLAVSFTVFHVLAMFSAIQHFVDPLDKLIQYVKKGKMDKYGELLPKIMSRKTFALRVGSFLLLAGAFLIAIIPMTTSSVTEVADKLTPAEKEFRGVLHSYSQKMRTLVSLHLKYVSKLTIGR